MDEVLKSEVVLVVMEKEEGVRFNEFAGLFHMVHGYPLTLSNYGYKSLKAMLKDMKDVIELKDVDGEQIIKYKSSSLNVISPQENESNMLERSASLHECEPQLVRPTNKTEHSQLLSSERPTFSANDDYTTDNGFSKTLKLSKNIEKIISEMIIRHPHGVRARRLRKIIMHEHNIDLELYSKDLGYTDMLSMLKEMPAITFVQGSTKNVLKPSGPCEKPKSTSISPEKNNSKERILETYNTDLEDLSTTDTAFFSNSKQMSNKQNPSPSDLLQPIAIAKPTANLKFRKKFAMETFNAGLCTSSRQVMVKSIENVIVSNNMKKLNKEPNTDSSQKSSKVHRIDLKSKNMTSGAKIVPNIPSKCFPSSTSKTTPSKYINIHATSKVNISMAKTVASNLSYASVCANNLGGCPGYHNIQCFPPSFNVQKIKNSKVTHPSPSAESKGLLLSSSIKENLCLILKFHSKGLSIFQLQKLYLLNFNQPLTHTGISVRKLLKDMKDVAKIKGVGVQLMVFPAHADKYLSVNTKILKGETDEREENSTSVTLLEHQPFSEGHNQTNQIKLLVSVNSNNNHTCLSSQHPACDKKKDLDVAHLSNSTHKPSAVCSQIKQSDNLSSHFATVKNDVEWPNLPQKYHILKEIKQHERGQNKPCFKQKATETLQEHNINAITTHLQVPLDLVKINSESVKGQHEHQSSTGAHPIPHSDLFVEGIKFFSFVKEEINADIDSLPSKTLKVPAQNVSDLRSNSVVHTYDFLSSTAAANSHLKHPHTGKYNLQTHTRNWMTLIPGMQQKQATGSLNYELQSPVKRKFYKEFYGPPQIVSASFGFSLAQNDQQDNSKVSSEEDSETWQKDYNQSCFIL